MAMRLIEVHPALTHYPLALFPAAMGVELAARLTGREDLERFGRVAMPVATSSAAVAGATGLMAEQQVRPTEEGGKLLARHRNLNIAAVGATTAMTAYRMTTRRPGWGYLATGLGVAATMAYTGYLGGRMVYGEGVGVERAEGVKEEESPPLRPGNFLDAIKLAGRQIGRTVSSLFKGLTSREPGFGPDPNELQDRIESDTAGAGALPLGSSPTPM